jgi:uncharacterized surface protein with fasciclin (FAS1) repeats
MIRARLLTLLAASLVAFSGIPARADAPGTIVAVASSNQDLSTLVSGPGPFTVFAPTNEAFAALPKGTLASLLRPENKAKLKAILLYHVVPGKLTSSQLMAGELKTAGGQSVTVATTGGVKINGASVVKPDVEASNGVVHVIDMVLLPKS